MSRPTLGIYRTHPDCAMPTYGTQGAACFDLRYQPYGKEIVKGYDQINIARDIVIPPSGTLSIWPRHRVLIPSGIIFAIPEGHSVRLHIRSSIAFKLGMNLANSEAVIDSDYFHESFIMVYNMSDISAIIEPGDRIAQAELVMNYRDYEIMELKESVRQTTDRVGGLGSTGKT